MPRALAGRDPSRWGIRSNTLIPGIETMTKTSLSAGEQEPPTHRLSVDQRVEVLLATMTLEEKIGQMVQVDASDAGQIDSLQAAVREGRIGALIHLVDVDAVNEFQRIAVEESRLGIPLLIGRDVVHGFRTVMPIPLGQAASWNPDLIRRAARVAALEAASAGVNWTFAPMIDISRDPRWGRIAESLGEDAWLTSELGKAMVEGFQGEDLAASGSIAACAKHFAGYGAAESGRDYAATNIPENELRNVYLRPFKAAADAGAATFMASFSDIDGVPASGNAFLMRQVLREEWDFKGFVVSDWDSIGQLQVHGLTASDRESAFEAVTAGVDMEMAGRTYSSSLADLVGDGRVDMAIIDMAVANVLRVKFALGLFDSPCTKPAEFPPIGSRQALAVAREAALQSIVLLKNDAGVLPLSTTRLTSLAVIGPLADAPYEQLGTWIFDGDPGMSVTALQGIRDLVGDDVKIRHVRAMDTSRSRNTEPFAEAVSAAAESDAVVLFLGEESILSGEAHSRADIGLPGAQAELVRRMRATGKPLIAVIMAGRPLTLADFVDQVDAVFFAWHPGTMGGAAIADLLFGIESPSGKLPATFPKVVGQIPIYYNHKNTGKPPTADGFVHIDDIDAAAPQTSLGMQAFHLDAGYTPLYPFGYGLSYVDFVYENLRIATPELAVGESLAVSVEIRNAGSMAADEIVQLYVRDLVGNVTRPVRELKGFRRIRIDAGQTVTVEFSLHADDLAFFGRNNRLMVEPGCFHLWVGGSSDTDLRGEFTLVSRE